MSTVIDPVEAYAEQFARLTTANRAEPAWLVTARRRAFASFQQQGFPTTRDEEWRFTSVAPIAGTEFADSADAATPVDRRWLDTFLLPMTAIELVFVNGRYSPEHSRTPALPDGIRVESLSAAVGSGTADLATRLSSVARSDLQPFVALNTALWTDGALVWAPRRAVLEAPIHLVFVTSSHRPLVSSPRVLVVAEPGSQVSVIETYVGRADERYFTNSVTEVMVAEQAIVHHYKVQRESESSYHISTIHGLTGVGSSFHAHSIGFGGALVRNDVIVTMDGAGGDCELNGLYVASDAMLVDNHTTIDHAKPHNASREVYKGILSDHARGVFNGKIIVRQDAQKTDAKQTNKALLLSGDAQINTKPQLEILANDVRCTHGAAIGQMDEDALFYLRARGLPLQEARSMLIHAFAGDVLNRMPFEPIRARVETELLKRLAEAE